MARPKKEIDWEQVFKWFKIQATNEEIAAHLGVCIKTLERRVLAEFGITLYALGETHRSAGRLGIRLKMYEMAETGDRNARGMLQYLDKKFLGGLPPDQIPGSPPALPPPSPVQVNIHNPALTPGEHPAVKMLREVLGKPEPALVSGTGDT